MVNEMANTNSQNLADFKILEILSFIKFSKLKKGIGTSWQLPNFIRLPETVPAILPAGWTSFLPTT